MLDHQIGIEQRFERFCQEHKPCGFLLTVVNSLEKTLTPFLHGGLHGQFCPNLSPDQE